MANQNEYGQDLYFNLNYDCSSATAVSLVCTLPDATTLTVTPTLQTTASTVTLPNGDSKTYAANEHYKYTLTDGDIDTADKGEWKAVITVTFGSTARLTATDRFEVYE